MTITEDRPSSRRVAARRHARPARLGRLRRPEQPGARRAVRGICGWPPDLTNATILAMLTAFAAPDGSEDSWPLSNRLGRGATRTAALVCGCPPRSGAW